MNLYLRQYIQLPSGSVVRLVEQGEEPDTWHCNYDLRGFASIGDVVLTSRFLQKYGTAV